MQLSQEFSKSLLGLDKHHRPRIVDCIYTLANGARPHHYPDSVASPHAREDLRGMIHVQRANGPLHLVWSVDVDRASYRCAVLQVVSQCQPDALLKCNAPAVMQGPDTPLVVGYGKQACLKGMQAIFMA